MAKQIDFSPELPAVGEVNTAAGAEQLRRAADYRSKASQEQAQRTESTIKFLGTQAIEAARGKSEADLQGEIEDIIKKTKFSAAQDIAANDKKLAASYLADKDKGYLTEESLQDFRGEAQRYALARAQGLISNDEAITRMGEVIKRYSAQAPGLATEYRKIGAELTGISNLDVYGLHKDLLDQTAREAAAAQAKKDLELKYAIAKEYGYKSLDEVPADVFELHRKRQFLEQDIKARESERKVQKWSAEDATKKGAEQGALIVADGLSGVMSKFIALHQANLSADTVEGRDAAQKQGAKLSSDLDVLELALSQKLRALATGPNPMDPKTNQELVDNLHKTISGYKEYVKTADGYNWFIQNAKNAKADVAYMMDRFKQANPMVEVWREHGVVPQVTQAYFTMTPEAFKARFTEEGYNTFQRVMGADASGYMRSLGRVVSGKNVVDEADPDTRKALVNDVYGILNDLLKKQKDGGGLNEKEKQVFAHLSGQFGATWQPTPAGLRGMKATLLSPEGLAALSQLRPDERAKAITPVADKVAVVVPNTIRDVQARLEQANALNKARGYGDFIIRMNPINGRLEAIAPEALTQPAFGGSKGGAATGRTEARRFTLDTAGRENLKRINERLDVLNLAPDFITSVTPLLRTDVKPPESGALTKQILDSIYDPKAVPVDIVGKSLGVAVPKNADSFPSYKSTSGANDVTLTKEERAAEIAHLKEEIANAKSATTKRILEQALKEMQGANANK